MNSKVFMGMTEHIQQACAPMHGYVRTSDRLHGMLYTDQVFMVMTGPETRPAQWVTLHNI